jgi:hypothetical protein
MTSASNTSAILEQSIATPSEVKLIIYHQLPGIELISPAYAGIGTKCYLSPDQNVDVGFIAEASFNIDFTQEEYIGVLMYKLQKKHTNQSNENAISNENEVTYIQLVITWKGYKYGKPYVYSFLIEHDKECVWSGDRLVKLATQNKLFNIKHASIKETWLIHDNTVLMTNLNVIREEEYYELEMTISETSIKYDTRRPWYIGLDR